MAEKEEKRPTWWEFYVIRYAMGTVVGGAIFFYLCKQNCYLNELLLMPNDGKLDYYHYLLLALYGLTYCYIASAPILVLHATRYLFEYPTNISFPKSWGVWSILLSCISVAIICFYMSNFNSFFGKIVDASIFSLTLLLIIFQLYLLNKTIRCSKELHDFYKKLSEKRNKLENDLLESYKHLREHGNSFGIVFLELFLGIILFMTGSPDSSINQAGYSEAHAFVIFLWVLPASVVWLVGTAIERRISGYKI